MFFQILALAASLEMGGLWGGMYNYTKIDPEMITVIPLYAKMEAMVSYQGIYVGGQMDCYYLAETVTNYVPFQMTYIFRAGYKTEKVQIGYEHSCFHPFSTYSNATIVEDEIKPKYEGGYDKFFIKFMVQ